MRLTDNITELRMTLPLPRSTLMWFGISAFFTSLYIIRSSIELIPPQDHVALSLILCFLLGQSWLHLEQTRIRINLPHNRCRVRHHRMGVFSERSLPVSQIHSARVEFDSASAGTASPPARMVLVTSLGMIPASLYYSDKLWHLDKECQLINGFLESSELFFHA